MTVHLRRNPRRRSLRTQFFVIAVLAFVLPMIILGFLFQKLMLDTVSSDYGSLAMASVNQVANQLTSSIRKYEVLLTGIASNEELSTRLGTRYTDTLEVWETVNYARRSFSYAYDLLDGIMQLRIYHDNDTLVEDGELLWCVSDRMLNEQTERDWYNTICAQDTFQWSVLDENSLNQTVATLSVRIGLTEKQTNGAVYLQLSLQSALGEALQGQQYMEGVYALTDENGRILLATRNEDTGGQASDLGYGNLTEMGMESTDDALIICMPVNDTWMLYGRIPLSELTSATNKISTLQTLSLLLFFLLGCLVLALTLNNFIHRLHQLDQHLDAMARGELDVNLSVGPNDILGTVENRFNLMNRRIRILMQEVQSRKMREMEERIRTMESYINPHFLYNILGLIRWRAMDDQDDTLCQIVDDMTTYYRLSLSSGRSLVSVEDEIDHLQAYIDIQRHRYREAIQVDWLVDNEALMAYTPKNILQTLVENSYLHGMITTHPGSVLTIHIQKIEGTLRFMIADNGAGIPPEKLEQLQSNDPAVNPGIGIRSVRQRLHLYFGEQASMVIHSEPGKGTCITIEIPFCLDEPTVLGGI